MPEPLPFFWWGEMAPNRKWIISWLHAALFFLVYKAWLLSYWQSQFKLISRSKQVQFLSTLKTQKISKMAARACVRIKKVKLKWEVLKNFLILDCIVSLCCCCICITVWIWRWKWTVSCTKKRVRIDQKPEL